MSVGIGSRPSHLCSLLERASAAERWVERRYAVVAQALEQVS